MDTIVRISEGRFRAYRSCGILILWSAVFGLCTAAWADVPDIVTLKRNGKETADKLAEEYRIKTGDCEGKYNKFPYGYILLQASDLNPALSRHSNVQYCQSNGMGLDVLEKLLGIIERFRFKIIR
jgi:hypothetical protein